MNWVQLLPPMLPPAPLVQLGMFAIHPARPVHAAAAQTIVAGRPAGRGRFDTLVVRAVAPLGKLLGWFGPVIDSFGRMLLVKGPRWEEERDDARFRGQTKRVLIRRVASWPIEGRDHESVLLEVRRRDPTA